MWVRSSDKSLRGDIAQSSPRSIEEVAEVSRVVIREEGRLEGRDVGEQHPQPGGHHYVL